MLKGVVMNSLRDKLLKAGLVTEEEAKRAESERKRPKSSKKGRTGSQSKRSGPLSKEQRLSPEELAAAEARRLERAKREELERERLENKKRAEEQKAKAQDIRRIAEFLAVDVKGETVFHFTTRRKKLQRMLLSDEAVASLERGELAIIDNPLPHALEYVVVPREGAEAALKIDPRSLRFYNRSEDERFGIAE